MEIAAETGNWSEDIMRLGYEFVDSLASLDMSGSRLTAVFSYLRRYNGTAVFAFTDIARSMGSDAVRKWLDDRDAESDSY
jgi:hypothetical protein